MSAWRGNVAGRGCVRLAARSGLLSEVGRPEPVDPALPFLAPGWIDLQLNGCAGVDFSAADLAAADLPRLLAAVWATGCTTFCPTLITAPRARLERNLRVLEAARATVPGFAAAAPCYHLEGPYLSPGPSHGAHEPAWMHAPDWDEFAALQDAAGGRIGIVTLAPELPGALPFIARARAAGVLVALSHTDGTRADIHAAAAAGARLSTHLGNGCPGLLHRHDAPFWAQLADDRLQASLICDGFHLPADHVKIIQRVKGADSCILVTDAVHVAGRPPGRYAFGRGDVDLRPSGQVVTADGRSLAGSTLRLDRAVGWYRRATGLPLAAALAAATTNPARLLDRAGFGRELAPGQPANLVEFDLVDEEIVVRRTILGGVTVHDRAAPSPPAAAALSACPP